MASVGQEGEGGGRFAEGVEREGRGGNGQEGEGGDGGPLRDKGVEMGGEEGKGRRNGEGGKDREGSAITGPKPYC